MSENQEIILAEKAFLPTNQWVLVVSHYRTVVTSTASGAEALGSNSALSPASCVTDTKKAFNFSPSQMRKIHDLIGSL